ncbi:hypothetical protein PJI23_31940, partial [Mycobacterium kansasii]
MFDTADPESVTDLAPPTQISQSTQSTNNVLVALVACLIGSVWMVGAVAVGVKNAAVDPLTAAS